MGLLNPAVVKAPLPLGLDKFPRPHVGYRFTGMVICEDSDVSTSKRGREKEDKPKSAFMSPAEELERYQNREVGAILSYLCQGNGSGSTPNLLVANYSTCNARGSEACSSQSHSATPSGIGPSPKRSSPTGAAAGELSEGPWCLAWTAGASLFEHAISRPCIWERGGGDGGREGDKHSAPPSKVGAAEGTLWRTKT